MLYALKLLLIGLLTLPLSLSFLCIGLFHGSGKSINRISLLWASIILKTGGVRLKVTGLDRLDRNQQYIFMANHQSALDIPVLVQSLRDFQLKWMVKRSLVFVPFFGWALWISRQITVDRTDRSKGPAILKRAKEKIKEGVSVAIFPEGTRSVDGHLLPFKKGGFLLALKTRTPVVPITINGSGALLPRGDWRIRAGVIEVIVSPPIPVEGYHAANLGPLMERVRKAIAAQLRNGSQKPESAPDRVVLAQE